MLITIGGIALMLCVVGIFIYLGPPMPPYVPFPPIGTLIKFSAGLCYMGSCPAYSMTIRVTGNQDAIVTYNALQNFCVQGEGRVVLEQARFNDLLALVESSGFYDMDYWVMSGHAAGYSLSVWHEGRSNWASGPINDGITINSAWVTLVQAFDDLGREIICNDL